MSNHSRNPFKRRHFHADIILLCVRWYLRSSLSSRDLEEIMLERGGHMDHTTIARWVQQYAPERERRCCPHVKGTTDPWRVDETSIKVKKQWVYLSRPVDSQGNTLDFFFQTAWRTLQGDEMMNGIRKGQLRGVDKGDVRAQVALVATLFGGPALHTTAWSRKGDKCGTVFMRWWFERGGMRSVISSVKRPYGFTGSSFLRCRVSRCINFG